ncbi:hypothetical protein [Methanobacterium sp.]|uniref:hypothetical protein n=1 Tax=Methanobacterium sp. TaxID=2164 RepID=UPI003C73CF5B
MQFLASCKECGAPQGIFNDKNIFEKEIIKQNKCWHCNKQFISSSSSNIINLNQDDSLDILVLKNKLLDFWSSDWENKYKIWLDKQGWPILDKTKNHYEQVSSIFRDQFRISPLWVELCQNLKEFDSEYNIEKEYPLLLDFNPPKLYKKSFDSFLLKTFRKNILNNQNLPNEPDNGWIFPNNWYSQINDIVRTLFVVKYLDGVNFMVDKIESLCKKYDVKYETSFEAKDEGYYAAHLSILQEFEIPKYDWDTTKISVRIEIQITTQLQEVIRKLLHKHYEENRKTVEKEDIKWQWNYKSDEFSTNYLGHILHYVEGMIMEIRDKGE